MSQKESQEPVSTTTSLQHVKCQLWVFAIFLVVLVLLAACGASPSSRGELGDDQRLLASCDSAHPPASWVAIDGTGSSAADAITAERMTATETIVRQTAVCSGRLRVIVFSSSSAATTILFDGPLKMDGATDNARLKRVPAAVADVMDKIRKTYGPAVASLSQGGSDITAQYRLAGEWAGQLEGDHRLHLYLLTDGFQNIGVDLGARAVRKDEAAALAQQVAVPMLPEATVVVAGLGRIAGTPPPSNVVEGLIAYYDALCRKTAAARCVSVTDYATEGK
jgi:hypothetical protein